MEEFLVLQILYPQYWTLLFLQKKTFW